MVIRTKGKRLTRREALHYSKTHIELRCLIRTGWCGKNPEALDCFIGRVTRVRNAYGHIEVCISGVCGPISNIKSWSTVAQWKRDGMKVNG